MGPSEWILAGTNALAASTVLTAGLGKQVSPEPVGRALSEIVPGIGRASMTAVLRGFAAAEIVIATMLLVGAARMPAAFLTSVLGVSFVAIGLRGLSVRSSVPCGCFGSSSRRPLGWANVGVGLALTLAGPVNVWLAPGAEYQASALLMASIASIALCLFVNRHLILQLVRPAMGTPAGSEVH